MIRCFCGDEEWQFSAYLRAILVMGVKTVLYSFHIFHIKTWRKGSVE